MDGQRRAESEVWDKDGEVDLREGTGKIIRLKISLKRGIRQASDCVGEPARMKKTETRHEAISKTHKHIFRPNSKHTAVTCVQSMDL